MKCKVNVNMHRSNTVYKPKQSKAVLYKYVSGFWCERTAGDGLLNGRSIIMDYGLLAGSNGLKPKVS